MIKTFRLMLLTLLTMVCGSAFAAETTVKWIAADQGYGNGDVVSSEVTIDDNVTMVLDKGTNSNSPKYYTSGAAVRLYGGGTLTLSSSEKYTIKKVVFTFGDKDGSNAITTEVGTYADGTWEGESQNVVFSIDGTSGHRRFASVEVTYDVAEATPASNEATWNATSGDALQTIMVGNDLSLKWEEGGGDQSPKYSGSSVYFYNGNRVTVAGASDAVKIQKIVFKFKDDTKVGLSTCDASGKNVNNTGITNDNTALTTTWEGEANRVIFRASQGTGVRYIESITVTYTGSAPVVVKAPVLAITDDGIAATYDMDANGVFVVYYENQGNAAAENAKLTLFVDGAENASKTIGTLNIGAKNFWNAKYNLEGIEAGEHQVYLKMTADNAEDVQTTAKTVTFTKKAPEPAFTISASAVTVPYNAESYNVVATLKETNNVAATAVKVELKKGTSDVLATQTVETLAANGETQVTLTVAKDLFETGEKTYNLYVNDKYLSTVAVTFEEAPVVETKSLEITAVDGTIKLGQESNTLRITVQNTGNVDITDAAVVLKKGDTTLGQGTVSAKAGQQGWANITVDKTGLEAGTITVTAIVTLDEENKIEKTAEITVEAAAVAQAAYSVAAENVTVAFGAESFEIKATVKNTSEVEAKNVVVKLTQNIQNVVEPVTIETLTAGAEETVTFTVAGPFTAGTTAKYYVQVGDDFLANKAQQEVNVTFAEAPVEEVKDLAITEVLGTIELANETNNVRVSVKNNGTVDITDAAVTLTADEKTLGTATVSAAAGQTGFCMVAVASEGLEAGELAVVATVEVEGDANLADNTMEAELTVKAIPAAEATFEVTAQNVEVLTTDTKVKAIVNVKNTSEVKADQVEVKLLNGTTQVGESQWIFGLEAGADQNVTFEFANFDKAGTYQIQAVAGKQNAFFDVIVKAPVADLAIESITGTINLANTSSNVTVAVKNNGTANVSNAKATLSYNEQTLESTIAFIKAGEKGYAYFQVPSEGLEAGELAVTAKVEYDEKSVEQTATLTVTAAPAAEATFSVTAENVEVPFGAESFEIKATVKNTSEVTGKATVKLLKGITEVETKEVVLAAGTEQEVIFTITEIGEAGKTATYYVQAGKDQAEVTVTFAKEIVAEVKDVAIESIVGTIDLANASSNVTVTVKNNGNVDVKNAKVTLSFGETTLEKTVSAKAGELGYAYFQVVSEGITGETLAVTAAVELEGDANLDDNTKTENLTVKAAPAAEATFSLVAENVELKAGEGAEFNVMVTNTSEVNATGVEVKLFYGQMNVATQTVDINAGEAKNVKFSVTAEQVSAILTMLGDKTSTEMQVQAGKNSCFFNVTVVEEVEPVIDMALTQIQGVSEINLKQENKVMVWYKNNGNVATTATISATLNGKALEAQTVENVKAEAQNYVEFTLPVEGLEAGATATFVATIAAEGDTNADNNSLTKELNIVSGETAPAAEIAINPISGWEVEAGEQTVKVGVTLFNNGEVEAKDVKVELYKSYGDGLCEPQIVDVPAGDSNYKMLTFTFNYTFEAGKSYEFTAYTGFADADANNQMQKFTLTCPAPLPDVAVAKIADIEATTEENVTVTATLTNNSAVEAKEVKVGVYTLENLEYQLQGIMQTVDIAAGESADVNFNLGKLAAGNYTYYVRVTSEDANAANNTQDVNVKVTEPVVPVVNVELTAIQGISNIDLAAEANAISVWVKNEGNVEANATVAVKLNDTDLEAQNVTVKVGNNAYATFTLPTEGLEAGQKATVVATVTVEGNTSEATTLTREYDVVNSSVATEPVFEIAAANVTVPFGATSFEIKATVKNTSTIDASNVDVKLFHNEVVATQTIETLTAGDDKEVTFTVTEIGEAGKTATYYVQAPKAQAEVTVTFEEEPVEPVVAVAITAIQGQLSAENASNFLTVFVENQGNQDIEGADLSLTYTMNDATPSQGYLEKISVKAGQSKMVTVTFEEGFLVAGELKVEAEITKGGETLTQFEKTFTVAGAAAAEPTYSVTAQNVEVAFGAESFKINAVVKNTSTVDAQNVEVKLISGTETVQATTIESLEAGAEAPVSFTINEVKEAGKTATYYVQAAGKAQAEVVVTFKEAPVAEVVDLAVTAIQGTLSLDVETNYLTVFVDNKGTVDVSNATVTLKAGEKVLGTATVSAKAGNNGFCSIAVAADDLTTGEFTVTATVEVENDADLTNNTLEKTYTITANPVLSFTVSNVTVEEDDTEFPVVVTVKNTGKGVAENVVVKVYNANSVELGAATIASIAAGAEEKATVTIANNVSDGDKLQVWVQGVEGVQWITVTVTEATAIEAIKAKYGQNVQIFTLSGKKVNNVMKKGLYIINGKKVMVK